MPEDVTAKRDHLARWIGDVFDLCMINESVLATDGVRSCAYNRGVLRMAQFLMERIAWYCLKPKYKTYQEALRHYAGEVQFASYRDLLFLEGLIKRCCRLYLNLPVRGLRARQRGARDLAESLLHAEAVPV